MAFTTSSSSYILPPTPLPTIFTPPTFCGDFIDLNSWDESSSQLYACLPNFNTSAIYESDVYYSPGICPYGYTVDCSRFLDSQGPPVKPSETAVICCPESFTCNLQAGNTGCVYGTDIEQDATLAMSVQIRWQSSDLSLLQTRPLTTGLPTTRRHMGWLPESSLTFPYVFSANCSSVTDTWVPHSFSSCEPLTGAYYSPAICPSDWTVATTLTENILSGPPKEADETVAICCPSGLSRLPGICRSDFCVSATISTRLASLSLDLIRVRTGVQVRWGATDMRALETHPLTPGLILPRQTVTIEAVPTPPGFYRVGIGLAFLPVLLSVIGVAMGSACLYARQHAKRRSLDAAQQQPRQPGYKPASFSISLLVLLIAVAITSLILMELSCHIVLHDNAPDPYSQILFGSTNSSSASASWSPAPSLYPAITAPVSLGQRQVAMAGETATLPMGLSCWNSTSIMVDSYTRTDIGTFTTYTESLTSFVCAAAGTSVALPSMLCMPGPGAAPGEQWLGNQKQQGKAHGGLLEIEGSPDAAYFFASMLPTLLASLFSIPWKIMHVDAALLEPFRQITLGSSARKSVLGNYEAFHALRAPMPFVTMCVVLASAAITALSSEGWGLRAVGMCDPNKTMAGCVPVIQVNTWIVHVIMAILCLLIMLVIILAVLSRLYSLGVYADPRSILGVATLAHSPGLGAMFSNVDQRSTLNVLISRTGHIPLQLTTDLMTGEYGIQRSDQTPLRWDNVYETESPDLRNTKQSGRMPVIKILFLFGVFTVFLAGLMSLTAYYLATFKNDGFERFMDSTSLGPRLIFTICGIAVNFGWIYVFQIVLRLLPYYSLNSLAPASKSILQSYSSDHFSAFFTGIYNGDFMFAIVALPVILSEFLPLLLATIPYRRTTTWMAHLVSSWMAVGVLGYMIVTMLLVIVLLFAARPKHYLNVNLLTKTPLAATLLLVSGSSDFLNLWRGYAVLKRKDRDEEVKRKGFMYGLVSGRAENGAICTRIRAERASASGGSVLEYGAPLEAKPPFLQYRALSSSDSATA